MTVSNYNGILTITDIINGVYIKKRYIFMTKTEAIKKFKEEANNDNSIL